jgi:Spy/CpxP family protein refolding chaperone
MLHTSKLRKRGRNGFTHVMKRWLSVLTLILLVPLAASAYTVVLRNGRNVDIPSDFKVTRAGITYEYAAGLYVTIQMTSIDVAATERANGEPAGSLLSRASAAASRPEGNSPSGESSGGPQQSEATRRTMTDKDLEATRQRRLQSETLYERRRQELGLPSLEETRRSREAETRRLIELETASREGDARAEAYWRARAEELRTAMAVTDAEINYLRSKLNTESTFLPAVAYTSVITFPQRRPLPGRFYRGAPPFLPTRGAGPPVRVPTRAPIYGRVGFGRGTTRGQILFNGNGLNRGFSSWPSRGARVNVLPLPFYAPYNYNYSYDQSAGLARLQELEAERAGLQARWRLLEDEARRAGALPGWLRP